MAYAEEPGPRPLIRAAAPGDDFASDPAAGSPAVERRTPAAAEVGQPDSALEANRRGRVGAPSVVHGEWSDHRLAQAGLAVAAILAGLAWLSVAGLVFLAVAARDAPEGTTGFAVVVLMPYVLVPALGLTAAVALLYRKIRGGRVPLLIAVVTTLASLVVGCFWWEVVSILLL